MNISIDNDGISLSNYDIDFDTITLGYEFTYAKIVLSETKFNIFIADTLTHEFIHRLLMKEFNVTVSKLFDSIEHFIGNIVIKETVFENIRLDHDSDFPMSWHDSIIKEGFKDFLECYHIDNTRLNQAFIIAGGK